MKTEFIKQRLRKGEAVRLTSKGPVIFQKETGYCGEVFEDRFEFKEVLNGYEHFSNISDHAQTKTHVIRFEDVVEVR